MNKNEIFDMEKKDISILIVEDEEYTIDALKTFMNRLGYNVLDRSARTAETAIQIARDKHPDLILMDIKLNKSKNKKDLDGIDAAALINQELNIPIIFITAYSDDETIQRAKIAEPYGYIIKPIINEIDIKPTIEIALYNFRKKMEWMEKEEKLKKIEVILDSNIQMTNNQDDYLIDNKDFVLNCNKKSISTLNAIGNKYRLEILKLICNQPTSFEFLVKKIQKAKSTISFHLNILEKSDLIKGIRQGKNTFYYYNKPESTKNFFINQDMKHLTNLFMSLRNEIRFKIFCLIIEKKRNINDLSEILNKSTASLNHHLRQFQRTNLIIQEKNENATIYTINYSRLNEIYPILIGLF